MQPNDWQIVRVNARDVSEPLGKTGNVFAFANGVDDE